MCRIYRSSRPPVPWVVGYVTDSTCAYVTALQNNTLQEPVQWYSGLCGTPRVAGVDGRVYLAVREATNQSLVIRSWQPGGTVEPGNISFVRSGKKRRCHSLCPYAVRADQ